MTGGCRCSCPGCQGLSLPSLGSLFLLQTKLERGEGGREEDEKEWEGAREVEGEWEGEREGVGGRERGRAGEMEGEREGERDQVRIYDTTATIPYQPFPCLPLENLRPPSSADPGGTSSR